MFNTLYELLQLQSKQRSNRPAILSEQRPSLTFERLFIQIATTVDTLRSVGIRRNDRAALVLADGPEMLSAFLAVGSGATAAPLNPAYQTEEFEDALVALNIKAVIVAAGVDSPVRAVARARRLPIIELSYSEHEPAGVFRLECDQAVLSDCSDPAFALGDDVALVLRTSGTTGRPTPGAPSRRPTSTGAKRSPSPTRA